MKNYSNSNTTLFSKASIVVALSVILGTVTYAWTGPGTMTPQTGNAPAPINVGSVLQEKLGPLNIRGAFTIAGGNKGYSELTTSLDDPSTLTTKSYVDAKIPNCPNKDTLIFDSGNWVCKSSLVTLVTISSNVANYNLKTALSNPTEALNVEVMINPGVYVYSTSVLSPAFDTGNLPNGSTVTITNNGNIVGKGGDGGTGYGYDLWAAVGYTSAVIGTDGENGGPALKAQVNTIVINNGLIAGGGGGGGGGGYAWNNYYFQNYGAAGGGGGGGGQGYNPGSAGPGGYVGGYSSVSGNSGGAGTLSSAGTGASAVSSSNSQGDGAGLSGSAGGNGGAYGNPGSSGGTGSAQYVSGGYSGGQAGSSIIGNSYITWSIIGSRLGPVN